MMPLMPKSTAVWLIDNTALTFEQIAEFCGLHILEIQAIADDSVGKIAPFDPTSHSQLTKEEIERCEKNPSAKLMLTVSTVEQFRQKGPKYLSRAKRQDRPNGILWLVKEFPNISDIQVCKLLGTTKSTVESIRNKTYKSYSALKAQSPVKLGLCNQVELDAALSSVSQSDDK
ncbi:MAG: DUF1013 domain-containing protein [Candidatus Paracaedibacteraceae bacterium]|nr:DUF1013 domain-containing protein [Candidatus Paracaedibacteraceae bacterium]